MVMPNLKIFQILFSMKDVFLKISIDQTFLVSVSLNLLISLCSRLIFKSIEPLKSNLFARSHCLKAKVPPSNHKMQSS